MSVTERESLRPGDQDATRLSTAPKETEPEASPRNALLLLPRRAWRQLTSMRTALLLLFLFAVAAVPGSILPQRGLNQLKVDDYFRAHPQLAPALDRLSLFDVFAAPWFAAIYLLLFVSLIGCLIPRIRLHARAVRRRPLMAPRHLDRLAQSASFTAPGTATVLAEDLRRRLRRGRWRTMTRTAPDGTVSVSAEKGYLRETGNLVFHVALVILLAGVAVGGLWGWKGTVIVAQGRGFCDTVSAFDQFTPGRLVHGDRLPPMCIDLDRFRTRYLPTGQPVSFDADIRYGSGSTDPSAAAHLQVNHPLRFAGTRTYLLSHGYAPKITVTDPSGQVFHSTAIFLPSDPMLSSSGVVKLGDARPRQIGIEGVFVPTRSPGDPIGLVSAFPGPRNPSLSVVVYEGDLGLGTGVPQSVYSLDRGQITAGRLSIANKKGGGRARAQLRPGHSLTLTDGTVIRFDGFTQWASLQVSRDPGDGIVLVAAVAMLVGLVLSLTVRRRRLWFRLTPSAGTDRCAVSAGGLARTDSDPFAEEFARIVADVRPPEGQPGTSRSDRE